MEKSYSFFEQINTFISKYFKQLWLVSVIVIFIISSMMTWPRFGLMPEGLNRDEAALGYNAYSLLKTGKDEWGIPWPVSITSFGDQKLPGYVYTLIPFISVFGLEITTVRLPSLLAGYGIIIAVGLLSLQLSKLVHLSPKITFAFSSLIMLFVAVSPWHMHFSRVAYEAHLALALFCFGMISYNEAIKHTKKFDQRTLLIITSLLWSLTLLTYHSYHIFIPVFLLGLLFIEWKKIISLDKTGLGVGIGIGMLTLLLLFQGSVFQGNEVKSRGTLAINKEDALNEATRYRRILPGSNSFYERILFNPVTETLTVLGNNVASAISGEFLFVQGSNHGDHNPGHGNNMHLFVLPLVVIGIMCLWRFRKQPETKRILLWLVVAVVPAALTLQPRHEVRLATFYPVLEITAALGFMYLCLKLSRWQRHVLCLVGIFIVLYSALRTFLFYIYVAPAKTASHLPYHQLSSLLVKYNQPGTIVITDSPSSSPYIWYLFDNKIDPTFYQTNAISYNPSDEGFLHIRSIGNIFFEDPKTSAILALLNENKVILIVKPGMLPSDAGATLKFNLQETIKDSINATLYEIWEVEKNNNQEM